MTFAFFDAKPYDKPEFMQQGLEKGIVFRFFETKLFEDTASLAKGCDGVCVFVNDKVDKAVIDKLCALGVKAIALRCAGYNNVDIYYAKKKKLAVFNVPAYSPYAVAEHAMAMLLTLNRKTHRAYLRTRDHNFNINGLTGFDLYGKTVGIIGTGRIGKAFAQICQGFGMKILAFDKIKSGDYNYVDLDKLFAESDIISLHCPLTPETRHIINQKAIEKAKEGVGIINTSRGGLIDAKALVKGLKSKKVGFAALDVYEEEGEFFYEDKSADIMDDDTLARLISMPNVLVTSHQAFLTNEALKSIAQTTASNIAEYFKSGNCRNMI